MDELVTIAALRSRLAAARRANQTVALVPTMGYLHAGHMQLVAAARARADLVVMSIFVNPLQFAPSEDLARYPRDLDRDRSLAVAHGVDVLFVPTAVEMYPDTSSIRVTECELASRWEGAVRPGHFDGVLTVVAKLFNLVAPDVACFGQKDIQQLSLVAMMIRALNFPIELITVPTVRDDDGLALSSRNRYLDTTDRGAALVLPRALATARDSWRSGERSASTLERTVAEVIAGEAAVRVDYIAVVEPRQMLPVEQAPPGTIVAVAARVGSTRLIDNVILEP